MSDDPPHGTAAALRTRSALLVAALFLSGAAGLVLEVCWIRRATLVFGATLPAVSTVLAVFFLGLAVGSAWFGRRAARVGRPVLVYAALEVAIAVLALLSLSGFGLIEHVYGAAYREYGDAGRLGVLRVALVALVILPPTIAMGATLPLLCRELVRRPEGIARAVGGLYAINTLGAAIGAAASGFLLIPSLGVGRSIALAAALDLAAALLALAVSRMSSSDAGARSIEESAPLVAAGAGPRISFLLPLVFLTGFTGLAYEVLWTRFAGLLIRNTVHTYTITLVVVLAGIVLGSALASKWGDRVRDRWAAFGAIQVAIALLVRLVLSLPADWWRSVPGDLAVLGILMLPAAVLSGASFPLAVRLVARTPGESAAAVGLVAALNTLGGIAGSCLAGFLLIPSLGTEATIWLLTATSLAVGLAAWTVVGRARPYGLPPLVASILVWAAAPFALGTRIPQDFLGGRGEIVAVEEGLMSFLSVTREKTTRMLYIDRWWQGQSGKSRQVVAAHLPALLHPSPRRVLVVGVGVGQTASRFLMYDPEAVDCVDIEPRLFGLLKTHFESDWMSDPRVRLIEEDGRNHIRHTRLRYDVVSLEVGQLFRAGVPAFYTLDFYRDVRARLRPGGVVSQFLPIAMMTPEILAGVVRTFLEVFPHSMLWFNASEMLLIGVLGDTLVIDRERIAHVTARDPVRSDLAFWYRGNPANALSRPEVLLAGFLCGPPGLRRLGAAGASYRDDRPVLEYEASRVEPGPRHELQVIARLRECLDPVERWLTPAFAPDALAILENHRRRNLDYIEAIAVRNRIGGYAAPARIAALDSVLVSRPENGELHRMMGTELVRAGRPQRAGGHFASAARINDDDPAAHRSLGLWWLDRGEPRPAGLHLARAVALMPREARARTDLGVALAMQGRFEEARAHFAESVRLAPDDTLARENLARVERELSARAAQPGSRRAGAPREP